MRDNNDSTDTKPPSIERPVPIFPLPDHVLLPNFPTPYRVFEPRYCELVRDLLDREPAERWLVIPQLQDGWKERYFSSPPFHKTATLARLLRCRIMGDQYLVAVEGIHRCELREVSSKHLYRLAECEPLIDLLVSEESRLNQIRETLFQSILSLATTLGDQAPGLTELLKDSPQSNAFVYRVGSIVVAESSERQALIETNCPLTRAELVLNETARLISRVNAKLSSDLTPS